ncbi:DUF1127 domain-containing protein [Yoonia maritima]|uniref:DUF1127 domain-containing protein n=1 Tax=Yoonia maritima TaxID=1435347 RepID=UPI000D0EF26E|nr:DUF1127 domain-containing protein [Yoonia maritima]
MTVSVQSNIQCTPSQRRRITLRLREYLHIARQRHQLRRLDDHMLRDIGVSRHEAITEANKAPWDVPNHWTH